MRISGSDINRFQYEKNTIDDFEKKMDRLENMYEQKMRDTKEQGNHRLRQIKDNNYKKQLLEAQKLNEILIEMDQKLEKTEKLLEKEINDLKYQHQTELSRQKGQFEGKFSNNSKKFTNKIDDQNRAYGRNLDKVIGDHQQKLTNIQNKKTYETKNLTNRKKNELLKKKFEFEQKRINSDSIFKNQLNEQTLEQARVLNKLKHDHNRKVQILVSDQNTTYQNLVNKFKEKMAQSHSDFMIKYQNMIEGHKHFTNELNNNISEDINRIKQDLHEHLQVYEHRKDDPFYKLVNISPEVEDHESYYKIFFEVPKSDKNLFQLSAQGREIRLSYGRSFSEKYTDEGENKNQNVYHKAETYLKRFKVPEIVDGNKISQKFEEGILTFFVTKA